MKLRGLSINTSYFTFETQDENKKLLLFPQNDSDIQDISGRDSPKLNTMSELNLCFQSRLSGNRISYDSQGSACLRKKKCL